MDPWTIQLILVRESAGSTERRSTARDAARGLLHRVRPGVYVPVTEWEQASPEQQHVIAIRALAMVSSRPPVVSHFSAAVLHGLPVLRAQMTRVHVTVPDDAKRGLVQVAGHVAPVGPGDLTTIGGVLVTTAARTVVDIARAAPIGEGVIVADAALRAGAARDVLAAALDDAARRRGAGRARQAVAFARPEAESAAESLSRVTMFRLGIRPPLLQVDILDERGFAGRLDFWFPWVRVGGEVDGEQKYLALADGGGAAAARAVVAEKWREDRVRRRISGLARWGWREAGDQRLLGPILAAAGVHPASPRATFADYCVDALVDS